MCMVVVGGSLTMGRMYVAGFCRWQGWTRPSSGGEFDRFDGKMKEGTL